MILYLSTHGNSCLYKGHWIYFPSFNHIILWAWKWCGSRISQWPKLKWATVLGVEGTLIHNLNFFFALKLMCYVNWCGLHDLSCSSKNHNEIEYASIASTLRIIALCHYDQFSLDLCTSDNLVVVKSSPNRSHAFQVQWTEMEKRQVWTTRDHIKASPCSYAQVQ